MTGRHVRTSKTTVEVRRDPISGHTVVIAPARANRPGAERAELEPFSEKELEECPFEEGREDRTPPETFAVGPASRRPDSPGWHVRVVPNLYPAFERQEVIVHTPRHARSLGELSMDELADVASAWYRRLEDARAAGFPYPQLVVNEGRDAGASLPHTHSQLIALREASPAIAAELPNLREDNCALCSLLSGDGLEIAFESSVSLRAAFAPRVPYELLIAAREHEALPQERGLVEALRLLHCAIGGMYSLEGPLPFNVWLHLGAHWHFEVFPRLTLLAGLELGAGIYVNWLPPEQAAASLRSATA